MKAQIPLALIAAFCMGATAASAQITFDRAYWESLVGNITINTYTIDDLVTDPAQPTVQDIIDNANGADQVYDFSDLTFTAQGTSESEFTSDVASLPGAGQPEFSSANHASITSFSEETPDGVIEGTGYSFIELRDGAFLQLGIWVVTADSSFGITYSPPDSTYELPLTYQTQWTSSTTQSFGGFELEQSSTSVVEGYGTLMLPGGITTEALRIKTISDTGFGTLLATYDFLTLEGHQATVNATLIVFPGLPPTETLDSASYSTWQTSTAVEDAEDLPGSFTLGQNYPNPFNPQTVIPFELTTSGHTSLRIYDTLGREVTTLVDQTLPAGRHEASWTAVDLPGGVYFYSLYTGGTSKTRALMLLR